MKLRDAIEARVPLVITIPVLGVMALILVAFARYYVEAISWLLLIYLGLWQLWVIVGLPFAVIAVRYLDFNRRSLGVRSRRGFAWASSVFAAAMLPACISFANLELGKLLPDQTLTSPDGTHEIAISFRSTTRHIELLDPSCRVHIILRRMPSGVSENEARIDFFEASEADRPRIEWLQDRVRITFSRTTIELQKTA